MALENTFGLNDQTVSNDFEAANQMVASEVENSQVNGAELDFSTAEDPFGDLAGFNVDNIKKTPENNTGTSISNQGGGPGDPVPAQKPKMTMNDLVNLSNKQRQSLKNFSETAPAKVESYRDPMLAYGAYTFDQYTSNVDRYRGYGQSTFNKIGFNPLENNEERFNENTTGWQDFKRMTGQWGSLFGSAFVSNYRTISNYFTGESGLFDPDREAAQQYEKAMSLGMSSKETAMGKISNFSLNMAYSIGIVANVLAEEFALGLITTATGGGAGGAAAARTGTNIARAGERLSALRRATEVAKAGLRQTSLGGGAQVLKGGFGILKSFKDINNARKFYTGVKTGGLLLGKGAVNIVNPFRGTTKTLSEIGQGTGTYANLSNFAKASSAFGSFYRDIREGLFAVSEAQLEGGGVYNQVLDEQLDYYMKTHNGQLPDQNGWATIYQNAEKAGKLDTLVNVPIIYLSNRLVFDGLFKFRALDNALDAAEQATRKSVAKQISYDAASRTFSESVQGFASRAKGLIKTPKAYLGNFINYTKANFAEGVQESLQETAGASIANYYNNVYKNPALGGEDYARSMVWGAAKENIWSPQGAEIFLNGFLMGGGTKLVQNTIFGTVNGLGRMYNQKFRKERYDAYLKQKATLKTDAINAINGIMADPEKFFSRRKESVVNQYRANLNMSEAELNDDDKTFYDSKDEKTFDHIFTALDTKTFDLVINALEDMGKLSDVELASAFNLQDGTKAKDKLNEYITRANEIKDVYGKVNSQFSNPFNPKKYKKTNGDKYVNEVLAYKAYEDAKKLIIASQFGFNRATQRLQGLMSDLSTNRPVASASATDITVLQNNDLMNNEIKILGDEIKMLEQSDDPKQKELAAKKRTKLEALVKYSNALERYQAGLKSQTNVNENGQFEIPFNEEAIAPLRDAYKEYLKAIANINNDAYVFEGKIDDSFKKILDIYSLGKDAQNYLQNVNGLTNPEMFARHATIINETYRNMYEQREKLMANAFDEFLSINEFNKLTEYIAQLGVKLTDEELQAMVFEGASPTQFLDLVSGEPLSETDPRVEKAKDAIEIFVKLRQDKLAEQEAQEQAQQDEEEKKKIAEQQIQPEEEKPEEKKAKKKEVVPADLASRLEAAYNEYIDNNPEADITYDEYVETSAKAANIKAQYEAEQKKGAAAVTPAPAIKPAEPTPTPAPTPTAPVSTDGAKANVILPIGTSGSGKSTFIKSLPQENLVIISPDDMRIEFTGDINDKSKDKEIYIEAAKRAIEAVKNGKQVVFDTTNLTKEKRRPFIEAIKKAIPGANIQYKLMPLNVELAKQRIKADIAAGVNRANVSDETIDRHAASYPQMLEDIKKEDITEYKPVSVSTDARADIERRRKEELDQNFSKEQLSYYKDSGYASPNDPVAKRQPYFNFDRNGEVAEKANLFNQINAKYDAELTALEGAKPAEPTATPTPTGPIELVIPEFSTSSKEESFAKITPFLKGLNDVERKITDIIDQPNYKAEALKIIKEFNQSTKAINGWKLILEIDNETLKSGHTTKDPRVKMEYAAGAVLINYVPVNNILYVPISNRGKKINILGSKDLMGARVAVLGERDITDAEYKQLADQVLERYNLVTDFIIKEGKITPPPALASVDDLFTLEKAEPVAIDRKAEIQKNISRLEDQIQTTYRFMNNTDSNAAIVRSQKDIELYKQELKELKEELASLEEAQPVEVVVEETSGTEKAKSILDSVSSLREMPNTKLNDNTTATANLLELVADGKISSRDVLALVEQRRNEMLGNMNPTDLVKGDYVTFTDGRKGWVTSTNAKKNTVNVKMVGSPKGVVETIDAENLRKNLTTVEKKKIVKVEPVSEEVTVSKADQETIKESRDSLEDFKNNASKIKDIEKEMLDSKKTDNSDNNNDLLDLLGCDI